MPANPALTSPELAALNAGNADAPVYLSYSPDTVIATATVASTPSDPVSIISVSGTSADWLTARAGQMARFKDGSGNLVATRRVISTGGGTLKVDLSALADVGLIPLKLRSHAISAGDSVKIVERYDLWNRRPFVTGGEIFQDGDIAYVAQNAHPVDIYNVTINSQPGDYFCMVANGGTKAITAAITQTQWIMNVGFLYLYEWSYPASFTGVSGAFTSTLTATAPVGAHWIYCKITPSLGDVFYVERFIRVHSPADPPIYCNVTQDKRTRQSRSVTVRLVKERVADLPIKGYAAIWGDGTWGGSDVATATKKFCGFIDPTSYRVVPGFHEATIQIQGIGDVLNTIQADGINFNYLNFTGWESLPADGQNIYQIMHWIAYYRVVGLLQRYNWTTFAQITAGVITSHLATLNLISAPRSSVFAMLKRLAGMYEANIGSRSDGEMISKIHPSMMADRSAVVTRATLDATIYSNCTVMYQQTQQVGMLRYEGATSNSLVADEVLISQSPSESTPGQADSTTTESGKVVEDQDNINQRCGDREKMLNNPYPRVELDIPNNWDVFEMPDMERVVVNIAAQYSPTGAAFDLTCIPVEMEKTWIPGRKARTKLILEGETDGEDGKTITTPTPIVTTATPPLPPSASAGVTTDGSTVIVVTLNHIYKALSYLTTPTYTEITGTGIADRINKALPDPYAPVLLRTGSTLPYYTLTNGHVYYTSDILATSPTWTDQYDLTNINIVGTPVFVLRTYVALQGVIYLAWTITGTGTAIRVQRRSNYGATQDWTLDITGYRGDAAIGMDIDQYSGNDVCYIGWNDAGGNATVYRIVNGVSTQITAFNVSGGNSYWYIQKPLFLLDGTPNNYAVTGATNELLYASQFQYGGSPAGLKRKSGGVVTDISPATNFLLNQTIRSIVPTDNSNILAVVNSNTGIFYTSADAGATWATAGTIGVNNLGFFPRPVGASYGLYSNDGTHLYYTPSLTTGTPQDKTSTFPTSPNDIVGINPVY